MHLATPESINAALRVIEGRPAPTHRHATIDQAKGTPCLFSLHWTAEQARDSVTIHFQCRSGQTALIGSKRALWLPLGSIFIGDKPVGTGGNYRIAFPEPGDVIEGQDEPELVEGLVEALNAALAVPLKV